MNRDTINIEAQIWDLLQEVKDPEIPAISVVELGIITHVDVDDAKITVTMTPTFVGCPAIDMIQRQIEVKIRKSGFENVTVNIDYDTHWTSNRISEEGRKKLKEFGLAPPIRSEKELSIEELAKVKCPFCDSPNTTLNSPFGSTLCRAIHFCWDCNQGFEQFKPVQ